MNKLYHKLPFVLELFINGTFIFLYSFYKANNAELGLLSKEMVDDVKVILAEYRLALKKYNRKNTTTEQ